MKNFLSNLKWFFIGVRLFLPFVPLFVWRAFKEIRKSTIDYWKNSQSIVDDLSQTYKDEAMKKMTSEYSPYVFWACYGVASFLYLLGWLAMAWLTVEAFRLLATAIF